MKNTILWLLPLFIATMVYAIFSLNDIQHELAGIAMFLTIIYFKL